MPPHPTWTERAVLDGVGCGPAYNRARRYGASPLRANEIALEVVQETHCRSLAPGREYASEAHFRAWLTRVAVNSVSDLFRRSRRLRQMDTLQIATMTAVDTENQDALDWALGKLDEIDRDLIEDFYWNDLNYREIGEKRGHSSSWTYRRITNVKRQLGSLLRT